MRSINKKIIFCIQLFLIFMSSLILLNYMELLSSLYYVGPFQMSSNTIYFNLKESSLGSSLYSELSKLIDTKQIISYNNDSKIVFVKSQTQLANELQIVFGRGISKSDFDNERLVAIINRIQVDEKNKVLIDGNLFETIGLFQTNDKELKQFDVIININAIKEFKENNYIEYNSLSERKKILETLSKYKINDISFENISTIHIFESFKLLDSTNLNMIFVVLIAIITFIISTCLDISRSINEYEYQIKRGITENRILLNIFLSDLIFVFISIIISMSLYYLIFNKYILTLPDIGRETTLLVLISILLLISKNLYFLYRIRRLTR